MNASERLPANHAWAVGIRTVQRLEERIIFVGITVRPSVHCDGLDVAGRVESASGQHASELIADVAFEDFKGRGHQLVASCPVLIFGWQTGFAWGTQKMQQAGFLRCAGETILPNGNREIQRHSVEVASRCIDRVHAQFLERLPIADLHVGVHERKFYAVVQGIFLLLRHFRTEVRNYHVVAGENTLRRPHRVRLAAANIRDLDLLRLLRITNMFRAHRRAV